MWVTGYGGPHCRQRLFLILVLVAVLVLIVVLILVVVILVLILILVVHALFLPKRSGGIAAYLG